MQQLGKALGQSSIYAVFQGLTLLGSLISFPILTRMLSVGEYGALALVNTTATLLIALAKCGVATAFLRFYAQTISPEGLDRRQIAATAFWTTVATASAIALVYGLIVLWTIPPDPLLTRSVLLIVVALVAVSALRDLYYAFLRAEQRALQVSYTTLALRLGGIAGGLLLVTLLDEKVFAFFLGTLVVEGLAVFVLWTLFAQGGMLGPSAVVPRFSGQLLLYGAPLLMFEFASLANDYIDRFLIARMLGVESVGIYSVGYNLATYVQALIVAPVWLAVFPIYTRMWETQGRPATEQFLHQVLKVYGAVSIGIFLLIALNGPSLVRLLASEKFAPSGTIFVFISAALLIYGTTHILGAGFHLMRRTAQLATVTICAALLNVVLNVVLIPRSSLGSYLMLTLGVSLLGRRLIHVAVPWFRFLGYSVVALSVGLLVRELPDLDLLLADIVFRSAVAALAYVGCLAAIDGEARQAIRHVARHAASMLGRGGSRGAA
jgi:O-antigen/teichoic acid export membrane protein